MKRGFVVSAVLYPLLILGLSLMMIVLSMSDNRRKVLENLKLEVSEESDTDPEMSNSALYYKMQALEEAYAEMSSRLSEDRLEEFQNETVLKTFPVGSIFISTTDTNPASYIGGTWESYGEGRTLMGVGSNGTSTYHLGATGGSEVHNHSGSIGETSITAQQMPLHSHSIPALSGTAASSGSHIHTNFTISNAPAATISWFEGAIAPSSGGSGILSGSGKNTISTKASGAHTHSVTTVASVSGSVGGGEGHTHSLTVEDGSNISPYITVYFWKRTK